MGNTASLFLLTLLGSCLVTSGSITVLLRTWKASVGQHWTERARLLWSVRRSCSEILLICLGVPVLSWFLFCTGDCPFGTLIGGSLLGYILGSYPFSKAVHPDMGFKAWLRRELMSLSVIGVTFAIYFWLFWTVSPNLTWGDWIRVALGIFALTLVFTGKWMRWFLSTGESDPLLARLHPIVDAGSAETKVPVKRVWLADVPVANALALVLIGELMFTRRIVLVLDDEELAAVCRHELAHLAEPAGVKLGRLVGGFAWLPFAFYHPLERLCGPFAFVVAYLTFFLIYRLKRVLAHRMEKRADAAAIVAGPPPAIYARALEKLHEANHVPAVVKSKSMIHPSLYDRMLAAGVQPDYPRPLPPSRSTPWIVWCLAGIPFAMLLVKGFLIYRAWGK